MPAISVIMPAYKVEKYLNRCIESILRQTFTDFELIIVDDGSPDNCPAMIDEWAKKDSRIVVIHQENQGLSGARNSGIKIANGEYLTFVDSDDWISDTMLEELFNLITKYDADISICGFIQTNGINNISIDNTNSEEYIYNRDEFMNIFLRIKNNRCIHYAWGKLYRKELIDKDHYPLGMLNEDVEGMFKAIIHSNKIAETTSIGYFYYENNDSITRKKFGENFLCLNEVWRRILAISENEAPEYKENVYFNLMRSDFTILVDMLLYGDKEKDRIYQEEILSIRKRLRQNLFFLLKGPMVFNRKLLILLVSNFYPIIRLFFRNRQI